MTTTRGRFQERGGGFRRAGVVWLALWAFLPILLALPGCSGCNKDPATLKAELEKAEAEKKKKEAEKPKEDFERNVRLGTLPSNSNFVSNYCKPGHWTSSVLLDAKANNFDFLGDMDIDVEDGQSHPLPLLATPYELSTSRQISMPKGQNKFFDSVLFVPQNAQTSTAVCRVSARGGGRTVFDIPLLLQRMPSYQYYFIVLAKVPELYGYIDRDRFYCIKPFVKSDLDSKELEPYYRVLSLSGEKRPALPAHAMLWTSIAVMLWDDASPNGFDPDQQHALLDWLHWGGQIIMSGPDSLDSLKGSFLEPYLPAKATGAREISAADLAEINAFSEKSIRKLSPVKPWTGVKLEKHEQASFVPNSGELLVERRVGRGRIVVTAFRLSDRDFTTWRGVDEFYSAYLLRHGPREFTESAETSVRAVCKDARSDEENWDAARVTGLRYFARDEGILMRDYGPDYPKSQPIEMENQSGFPPGYQPYNSNRALPDDPNDLLISTVKGPGVAAWNDYSVAARTAREELNSAARIEVPKRSFVIMVLVLYLVCLVPFNWCFFRAINRVEWAWAAAPIIAIACTAVVIKLAQLDIGFVRSRNEIGVLEIQSDYARGHLTRYNALYTSLSTPYDFTFTDSGATALPFPTHKEPGEFSLVAGQERRSLRYVLGEEAMLQGVPVRSNSTTLMHSEEVFPLGGKLSLGKNTLGELKLMNQTKLKLQGIGIIKKEPSGNLQTAWITTIEPGTEKTIDWSRESGTATGNKLWADLRDKTPLTGAKAKLGDLNIRGLLNLAEKSDAMRPGEIKMIAWTDDDLPGVTISPASAQFRRATMVVAHLAYGEEPPPKPDENLPDNPRRVSGKALGER